MGIFTVTRNLQPYAIFQNLSIYNLPHGISVLFKAARRLLDATIPLQFIRIKVPDYFAIAVECRLPTALHPNELLLKWRIK
jgi:hypothetical protein